MMAGWFGKAELHTYKTAGKVVMLPIAEIAPNPHQPRRHYARSELEELAQSIRENGLLQPITVRRVSNRECPFELIAGHRRLLAVTCNGDETIPAIIQEIGEEASAVLAIVENLQRKQLNCFEEAAAMEQLMVQWGMTQQDVAKRLGKTQPTIANKLRLLRLSQEVREVILQYQLTERHARALLRLPSDGVMLTAAEVIAARGYNVEESEQYIETLLAPKKADAARIFIVKDYRLFLNTVKKAVDTMAHAGIAVDTNKTEDEEYIHYTIRIPKSAAYRTKVTPMPTGRTTA